MRRPYRLNRIVLGVIGLALLGASAYGLARRYGAFGTNEQHQPVLLSQIRSFVSDHHDWFWWAAGAACVVLALLALGWLRAQLHFPRPANDNIDRSESDGMTRVPGSAAADALASDISTLPGVASAAARIWGDPMKPRVHLRVQLHDDVDLDALRTRIETEHLDRLRRALQIDHVDANIDVRLAEPLGRLVR